MKKNVKIMRIISLVLATALLLGLFPASALDTSATDGPTTENFGMEELYVDAPEAIDPRYENYTIDKFPKELEESLQLDDSALKLDTTDAEDPYSLTTVNDDGTKTLRVFGEPVKYIDEETDKVEFIDTTLTVAEDGENAFQCTTNSKKSYFPKDISKGVLLTNGKRSVTMTPVISETKKNGKIKYKKVKIKGKHHAQYEDVFGKGTSLQYVPTVSGIKENIVLEEYNGTNTFSYIIDAKKLVPKETEGTTITFIDPETEEDVFKIDETFIYDSRYNTENRTESCVSYNNYYTVEKQKNGKYLLTTIVDKAFLDSPDTVYPVTIDPDAKWTYEYGVIECLSFSQYTEAQSTNKYVGAATANENWVTYVKMKFMEYFMYINSNLIESAILNISMNEVPQIDGNIIAKLPSSDTDSSFYSQKFIPTYDSFLNATTTVDSVDIYDWMGNPYCVLDIKNSFITKYKQYIADEGDYYPGYYLCTNSTNAYYDIEQVYLQIDYREDNKLPEDLYYIRSGNSYLYAKEVDDEIQVYWEECEEQPSTAYNGGYLWHVKADDLTDLYTIESYKQFDGTRNHYMHANGNDIIAKTSYSYPSDGRKKQLWHIVRNTGGTFRVLNSYRADEQATAKKAITKSSGNNATISEYKFSASQKWTFTPLAPSISVADGEIKSVSSWPANATNSSKNHLYGKTPQRLEYKANGTTNALGSGTAYPYVGSTLTNGSTMTNGFIDSSNVDIRSYQLTVEDEEGYMRYINRNTGAYREKGELYLDIVYNLGELKDVNCLWLATNTQNNEYQIGAFEVYTAQGTESLFFTRNKRGEFDHTSGKWSGVVRVDFSAQVEAKYIGIRVTQGVVKKSGNATWLDSELEHAYARIRDIAVFSKPITGISLTATSKVHLYDTPTMKYTITPADSRNADLEWSSSNTSVATINKTTGKITPKSLGKTTITVKTKDGGYTSSSELTVYVGAGGEYVQNNFVDINCFVYAMQCAVDWKSGIASNFLVTSNKTKDQIESIIRYINGLEGIQMCRSIESYDTPIDKDEYRVAIRVPNGEYASYHLIYQLSDGTWAGKNHTDPSKHFGAGNPSESPEMWEYGLYPAEAGTEYLAITLNWEE